MGGWLNYKIKIRKLVNGWQLGSFQTSEQIIALSFYYICFYWIYWFSWAPYQFEFLIICNIWQQQKIVKILKKTTGGMQQTHQLKGKMVTWMHFFTALISHPCFCYYSTDSDVIVSKQSSFCLLSLQQCWLFPLKLSSKRNKKFY